MTSPVGKTWKFSTADLAPSSAFTVTVALPFGCKSAFVGVTSKPSGGAPYRETLMAPSALLEKATPPDSPVFSASDCLSALTLWSAMSGVVSAARGGSPTGAPAGAGWQACAGELSGATAPALGMRAPSSPSGTTCGALGSTYQYH